MINPNAVRLDVRDFGKVFILTDIRPSYLYQHGIRTDERIGTTYEVAVPALGFEKIRVRVDGEQTIPDEVIENKDYQNVKFDNLEAHFYFVNNQTGVTATASQASIIARKEG